MKILIATLLLASAGTAQTMANAERNDAPSACLVKALKNCEGVALTANEENSTGQ